MTRRQLRRERRAWNRHRRQRTALGIMLGPFSHEPIRHIFLAKRQSTMRQRALRAAQWTLIASVGDVALATPW